MKIQKLASIAHKYLALVVGIQIFIWVATGLFFAIFQIENIRSEHLVKDPAPSLFVAGDFAGLSKVLAQNPTLEKIKLDRAEAAPIIIGEIKKVKYGFDGKSGQKLAPLSDSAAARIATNILKTAQGIEKTELVTKESVEYRADLPAWKVTFEDGLSLYVAQNTRQVTARRSDLWRIYDFLWSLHIMDYKGHEDFNHPLLVIAGLLAMLTAIAGLVLLPFRVKFRRR